MNTNPSAIKVLCYGDSNTNGAKPDHTGRFEANERWTGLLQSHLGNNYYIIEEGLGGRTTDLDDHDPNKPNRNGLVYFKACVDSHMPLDNIIIMLGTNDLKTMYNRSNEAIAKALKQYPEYVARFCATKGLKQPKIILVSPVYISDQVPASVKTPVYTKESSQKSKNYSPKQYNI